MYKIISSPYTKIFYNEWRLSPYTSDYNIVFHQDLEGDIDTHKLENALNRFVKENVLVNSHLISEDEELFWVENNQVTPLKFFNLSLSHSELTLLIEEPFNLLEGPLYRFYLIKTKINQYKLIIVLHHLIIDGSTIIYFCNEISNYYNNREYNKPLSKEDQIEKISRLSEHLNKLHQTHKEKSKQFWEDKLANIEPVDTSFLTGSLPQEKGISPVSSKIEELKFSFPKEILDKISKLKQVLVSPYFYGRAVFAFLLSRYSGQKKVCISYPIAITEGKDFIYGGQVNTTFICYDFSREDNFIDILVQAKGFIKSLKSENINYAYLPISELSALGRNLLNFSYSTTTLRDIPFGFNNIQAIVSDDPCIDLAGDWLFEQGLSNDTISCVIRYKNNKINKHFLSSFIESYKELFIQILEEIDNKEFIPLKPLSHYSLLSSSQFRNITQEWNNTRKAYPEDEVIHHLFEQQVEKFPDSIALVSGGIQLTYKELNEKANRLANYLLKTYNIQPDDLVAVCLDRNEHSIIALLAILKSGGAYVPLDPTYPDERIKYILGETQAKAIMVNNNSEERINTLCAFQKVIVIDKLETQYLLDKQQQFNPTSNVKSTNLSYIIYTSGTTGAPKGVMIEHQAVINLLFQTHLENQFKPNKHGTLWTNINFDVSVYEIFTILLSGGALHILFQEVRESPEKFFHYIKNNKINYTYIPSYFLTEFPKNEIFSLEFILLGVEKIKFSHVENILKSNKLVKILNGYGPTEATVFCTDYNFNSKDSYLEYLPIGTPLSNTLCYVLDENLSPVPVGATGELYIGGAGLARGYMNKPALTQEKFIPNPFQVDLQSQHNKSSKLYKTGDLVRWLHDGNLQYIGRNDFQIKIRGYRVELREIETTLNSYPAIKDSVVICHNHNISKDQEATEKYLGAYYLAEKELSEKEILKYLQSKLPDYMVPRVLMHLDKFPTTVNGKLDRKALPLPQLEIKEGYTPPNTPLEKTLCQIWSETLGIEKQRIGIKDDFFRLGGHSILAIKLASKINKTLNRNVSVSLILSHPTISDFVEHLEEYSVNIQEITPANISCPEQQNLSFSQERLWFIEKYEGKSNAYNVPIVVKLSPTVQENILEKSIVSIIDRHEILRTLIKETTEGKTYQFIATEAKDSCLFIEKKEVNTEDELDEYIVTLVNHKFELSDKYPIRVSFVSLNTKVSQDKFLIIVIHHIAFDGWSYDIFMKELEKFYAYHFQILQGINAKLTLPTLSIQYKDFAIWQKNYLTGPILDKHLSYWKSKLEGYETLNLITDYPRPIRISYKGENIHFELDKDLSNNLRCLAQQLETSLFSVLLAAYYLLLSLYSNQKDIVVGIPIANRHYKQLEYLVGCFVNSLPIRMNVNSQTIVSEFIKKVSKEVIEVHQYQDLPFEKLVGELNTPKDTSGHPIFKVMFGLQRFGKIVPSDLMEIYKSGDYFYKVSKFDVSTFIDDSEENIKGVFNYAPHLYKDITIQGFIETYLKILQQFADLVQDVTLQSHVKIGDLTYLTSQQQQSLLNQCTLKYRTDWKTKTISQLFEEQVCKTPHNIAVIYNDTKLTYQQLNEKANQLAHYLRTIYTITPDSLIAICLDRNEDMLIAILAIIKTGAAYVPIDPDYPDSRISYQLRNTHTQIVLTNEIFQEKLNYILSSESDLGNITIFRIDSSYFQQQLAIQSKTNLDNMATSSNLEYVIYTSGTTGNPKGVMIEHTSYVNFIEDVKNLYFANTQEIKTYSVTNYVFDIFGLEYGLPLLTGGTITIGTKDFTSLDCSEFHFIQMTPSLCKLKLNSLSNTSSLKLFVGGEELSKNLLSNILSKNIDTVNLYGPTETTIWSSSKFYSGSQDPFSASVTLGKPFKSESIYILDETLHILPVGAVGEIYIGGIGVARGYLNDSELTREKFIDNPFFSLNESQDKRAKLYKTGDLGRRLPNGEIEYIGRNDLQIKVSGYRVETGEIENALLSYEGIRQATILIRENKINDNSDFKDKYLVGYYTAKEKLEEEDILNYLGGKLPTYMIPRALISLDQFPLTVNGKLDEKALLDLPLQSFKNETVTNPQDNEYEKVIIEIWAKVLGLDAISRHDNFFDLGGNSLLLTVMYAQLPNEIKEKLTLMHFFQYTTVSKISTFLSKQ
jgi:amino acid adenylation domain-containing protein